MTQSTVEAEPPCPGTPDKSARPARTDLVAVRRPFEDIPRETWDGLAARSGWSTPFASWAFHRAWWDAYGASAHEETLVAIPADGPADADPVAIAPFMHRHEVEPTDALTRTRMRHGHESRLTPVEPHAKAIFFGASYHADYATLLAAADDVPAVAEAIVTYLADSAASDQRVPWDVVDLRRLRCGDPAADELAKAFDRHASDDGWTVLVEREDVCPVVRLPGGANFDDYLATLGKKERHEIRRKLRRADEAGEVRLADSARPLEDIEAFIELHQKRWGAEGLFPPTEGGDASRLFLRRLFELAGAKGPVRLAFLTVGDRRVGAGIHFQDERGYLYYNAGIDPEARELSPGVLMTAEYVKRALGEGCRRLDFLRGDEHYKYAWGAVDEPIQRILVHRTERP